MRQMLTNQGRTIGAFSSFRVALLALAAGMTLAVALGGCTPFAGGSGAAGATPAAAQPSPTPTTQEQLAQRVDLAVWGLGVQKLETVYDAPHATASVTITLGGATPNTDTKVSAAQELTKAFCLMAQQALWTSGVPLDAVTVTVRGPIQDPYAGAIVDVYGTAVIGARAARAVKWGGGLTASGSPAGVSADDAWRAYDQVFLRQNFLLANPSQP